ncbi:hypothetical protein V8C37DRAFT_377783 [Trichoderma ceciliae]
MAISYKKGQDRSHIAYDNLVLDITSQTAPSSHKASSITGNFAIPARKRITKASAFSSSTIMDKAAPAANAARDTAVHGDHVLQGGHPIMKEDTDPSGQDTSTSNVPDPGASKQPYGLRGTRTGDFQAGAGTGAGLGDSVRQRKTRSHVSRAYLQMPFC